MASHATLFERFGEILSIDVVVIQRPNSDGQVIVAIWRVVRHLCGMHGSQQSIPMSGVPFRMWLALSSKL